MADLSTTDLIQRVRDLIDEHPWETTSTTTGTGTPVAVPDGTRWEEGAIGEWQTGTVGGEQFYVQSVSSNNLTVGRGYAGTTAETHTSGDRVLKNPTYSYRQINQALNQAVLELWPLVYKTGTVTLTGWATTTYWHNLNSLTLDIVKAVQLYGSSSQFAGRFNGGDGRFYTTDLLLPTGLVASGKGIHFSSYYHGTNDITITDKRAVTGTTDIVDSSNLPVAEAVTFGAVGRLLQAMEIKRESWGESADVSGTVSSGGRLQTGAWYSQQFQLRKQALALRLDALYGPDRKF